MFIIIDTRIKCYQSNPSLLHRRPAWQKLMFSIIDTRIKCYQSNPSLLHMRPACLLPRVRKSLQFHSKYVLVPDDKAANNAIVIWSSYSVEVLHAGLTNNSTYTTTDTEELNIIPHMLRPWVLWSVVTSTNIRRYIGYRNSIKALIRLQLWFVHLVWSFMFSQLVPLYVV